MAERTAIVASKVGLHARPAATFTSAAAEYDIDIEIALEGGEPVDAASVLGVMTLGAGFGDKVVLTAEGEGAEEALDALVKLLETDLDA